MEFHLPPLKIEDQVLNELTLEEIEDEARKELMEHLSSFMMHVKFLRRQGHRAEPHGPKD